MPTTGTPRLLGAAELIASDIAEAAGINGSASLSMNSMLK